MKKWIVLFGLLILFSNSAYAADGDTWTAPAGIGTDAWRVTSSGDLLPGTTNTYDLGSASLYPKTIYLGGVGKTSWGSIVSPMTDATGYVNPTDAGNYLRLYDAGYIRLGDATNAGDYYILYTGDTDAWYEGQYDSTNDFVIGYGSTVGTDIRLAIVDDANTTTVTLGDGVDAYDKALIFDGNAFDFYMAYDDSADDLLIGVGSTVGTTPAISITDGQAISTYANITMTGTAPVLTVGDAGAEDTTVLFDGNAQDFYVALDDSADDLIIGLGNVVGTTPIIGMTETYGITTYGDITMTGTTPTLTVGDGGNEDNMVVFDGTVDWTVGVDTTASAFEIDNGTDVDQTVAISISTDEDVTLPSGSLYLIDDEFIIMGTNSDFKIEYDEAVDDQVLFLTTTATATVTTDPLFEFLVPTTPAADQQVFGVAKGSQATNTALLVLDEDGDAEFTGDLTVTGGDIISSVDIVIDSAGGDIDIDAADVWLDGGKFLSLDGSTETNYLTFSTNLQIIGSADILLDPAGGDIDVDAADLQLDAGKKLSLNGATETDAVYSSTDLQIVSAADTVITPTGGQVSVVSADVGLTAGEYVSLAGISALTQASLIYQNSAIEVFVNTTNTYDFTATGLDGQAAATLTTGTGATKINGDFQVNDGANKPIGDVTFSNAVDNVTITNSLIDAGSRIFLQAAGVTVGDIYCNTPGAGSVLVGSNTNETADFTVWYMIVND